MKCVRVAFDWVPCSPVASVVPEGLCEAEAVRRRSSSSCSCLMSSSLASSSSSSSSMRASRCHSSSILVCRANWRSRRVPISSPSPLEDYASIEAMKSNKEFSKMQHTKQLYSAWDGCFWHVINPGMKWRCCGWWGDEGRVMNKWNRNTAWIK